MAIQSTLAILKPDAVRRGLTGRIITRIEALPLCVASLRTVAADRQRLEAHYRDIVAKPFFADVLDYMTSGPVIVIHLEGEDAVRRLRAAVGATRPPDAMPGTIRRDFTDISTWCPVRCENLIHASDSPEAAAREIALWAEPASALSPSERTHR